MIIDHALTPILTEIYILFARTLQFEAVTHQVTEIYILFARTLQIEAGLLQFYSCNVKHMGTSELESTTSVPIRDLYSTV